MTGYCKWLYTKAKLPHFWNKSSGYAYPRNKYRQMLELIGSGPLGKHLHILCVKNCWVYTLPPSPHTQTHHAYTNTKGCCLYLARNLVCYTSTCFYRSERASELFCGTKSTRKTKTDGGMEGNNRRRLSYNLHYHKPVKEAGDKQTR